MKYGEKLVIRAQINDIINTLDTLISMPDDSLVGKLIKAMQKS